MKPLSKKVNDELVVTKQEKVTQVRLMLKIVCYITIFLKAEGSFSFDITGCYV